MNKSDNSGTLFRNAAAEFVYVRTYSRWIEDKKRRETWSETVQRYIDFLKESFGDKIPPKVIRKIHSKVLNFEVMPSMRFLWAAGDAARASNVTIYNCFEKSTRFVTKTGIKSFADFKENDEVIVLTHNGNWKKGIVKSYGQQELIKITVRKGPNGLDHSFFATENHQWLLSNGYRTNQLKINNKLARPISSVFDFNSATPEQKLYWCYGYVYGDGTLLRGNNEDYSYSMVRLCKKDIKFKQRFEEMGFGTSTSLSLNGDFIAYTGTYLKTLPDLDKDSPELIKAFFTGLLDADGAKYHYDDKFYYKSIQSTGKETVEFIRKAASVAGFFIHREDDFTDSKTNFGTRSDITIRFAISDVARNKNAAAWKVVSLEKINRIEEVWCLEVEGDHSFVLEQGIPTGNCSFSAVDNTNAFSEALYILMCGSGYGFSVEAKYINQLPTVPIHITISDQVYQIEDSRIGWADSVKILINSLYSGLDITLDYNKLRPAGARLMTMGGRSSGPAPLAQLHSFIRETFHKAQGRKLTSLESHDIMNEIAQIVVVGGVRRSSQISLSDLDDELMRDSKTGNFPVRRYMANNSAVYTTKPDAVTFMKEWTSLAASGSGERGIFNLESAKNMSPKRRDSILIAGANPCLEILLRNKEFCNLSEVVARESDDLESMLDKIETAVWMGILQSCLTDFPYLDSKWKENCKEERLLGVSITGEYDAMHVCTEESLTAYRKKAIRVAKTASEVMGINMPAAITCVKPSGSVSQLVDSSSGLHPRFANYYIRRYRISSNDPLFRLIRDQGLPVSPENGQRKQDYVKAQRLFDSLSDTQLAMIQAKSVCPMFDNNGWSSDKVNTWVVSFPVKSPEGSITVSDVTALEQLEHYKKVQTNWCEHNASITVYVGPDEWLEVGNWVYKNWSIVNGISFLPRTDHVYEQAPYEAISKEEYDKIVASFPVIDYTKLGDYEKEDNTEGAKSLACVSGSCEL